jgi:hypothetical protein
VLLAVWYFLHVLPCSHHATSAVRQVLYSFFCCCFDLSLARRLPAGTSRGMVFPPRPCPSPPIVPNIVLLFQCNQHFCKAFLLCATKWIWRVPPSWPKFSDSIRTVWRNVFSALFLSSYSILTERDQVDPAHSLRRRQNPRAVFLQCVAKRIWPTISIVTSSYGNLTVRGQIGVGQCLHFCEDLHTSRTSARKRQESNLELDIVVDLLHVSLWS